MAVRLFCALASFALTACAALPPPAPAPPAPPIAPEASADPARWPAARSPAAITDRATERRIDELLERMTLEQKVGQLIQADIGSITPADLERYPLGSVLAGGNSGPYGDERAPASAWARLAGEFRAASLRPAANGIAIPVMFGVDAVHGHNNIPNATIFPHNIGLGAARDPELIRRIGEVTAAEVAGSGIEWTFAPTLAVPQDLRWGRTYEGYSSDPELVAAYGEAMVLGLQGVLAPGRPLAANRVSATAKHFLADGGTEGGKDQGDALVSEDELIRVHAPGYPAAIDAGALTVMASFSSWNGVKHHGNPTLLTDVLKDRMGFAGFVVGDWNGHGQVAGCEPTDCPQALLAGLDMFMAPDSWQALYQNTLARAKAGEIPLSRIDDAVRRILRVKFKLGLFDDASQRRNLAALGAPDHLALAREAVAKSLVLLKNQGSVLPIQPGARVLVAGPAADDIAAQSGGWTVSWQGSDVTRDDFPNGQTVWEALQRAVVEAGGTAVHASEGDRSGPVDVAVVVYGEAPYAEFQGDLMDLDFALPGDPHLALLRKLKAKGIPVVSLFLSGRPLFVGPELDASDAFVAAWLPGTQAAGIADVLVSRTGGKPVRDFSGVLPFAWPAGCAPGSGALFPRGFGGSYREPPRLVDIDAECPLHRAAATDALVIYGKGLPQGISASAGGTLLPNLRGQSADAHFSAVAFDVRAQEDARELTWNEPAVLALRWPGLSFPSEGALQIRYAVDRRPSGRASLSGLCNGCDEAIDLTSSFALAEGKGWREMRIPLRCLAAAPLEGIEIAADEGFTLKLEDARLVRQEADGDCRGPF